MEISEGGLSFTFNGVLSAYKFDEQDQTSSHYHGLSHCMKGAEQKVQKPIYYLCLITLESALVLQLMNQLKRQLPEGRANNQRWQRAIADRCIVANLETWNSSFPHIPVQRVTGE